ncbi:hypothetical protein TR631_37150 [Streptomyces rochei]|nr:hypothetical protein [Streptomyces rochei]WQC17161.1 hypothetical protein TR631_37150 [Streptomyces rochei]
MEDPDGFLVQVGGDDLVSGPPPLLPPPGQRIAEACVLATVASEDVG